MSTEQRKQSLKNDADVKEVRKNVEMNERLSETVKRRIESMSDDEIIQKNLKELLEKKSREERKANGRLVAVILVFLVIFLAVYHVWIRKTTGLAGVLVPAVIMLSYGGWVVILAKRDKQKQQLFEKHLDEIVRKNKTELSEKSKILKQKQKANAGEATATTKLYFENELRNQPNSKEHRKHRRHRNKRADSTTTTSSICSSSSSSSTTSSHAGSGSARSNNKKLLVPTTTYTKDGRIKRPSIRQKLFKQKAELNLADGMVRAVGPATTIAPVMTTSKKQQQQTKQTNKKRLERLDAINKTPLARMSSIP